MSEKFGINSAFGDRAAVDGKIWSVFAGGVCMNDFREMLFTHTGFSGDKHTEIGACYLHGNLNVSIE